MILKGVFLWTVSNGLSKGHLENNSTQGNWTKWNPIKSAFDTAQNYLQSQVRTNPFLGVFMGDDDDRNARRCYGLDLGCFSNEWPFFSDGFFGRRGRLPESVEKINSKFFVYSCPRAENLARMARERPDGQSGSEWWSRHCVKGGEISWKKKASTALLTKGLPLVVLVHGWDSWSDFWAAPIKDEIVKFYHGQVNVLLPEWKDGADRPYPQAAGNARLVARQIKNIIQNAVDDGVILPRDIRIVGHSVGGQIAGYVGKEFYADNGVKIGRIDALDPSALMFTYSKGNGKGYDQLHLVKEDADFVQVVHTTGKYASLSLIAPAQRIGHADFYPNAGAGVLDGYQGGCSGDPSCNHSRSHRYYKRSINSAHCYVAEAEDGSKNTMGFHATKPPMPQEYFLLVSMVNPFTFVPAQDGCDIETLPSGQ